MTGWLVLLLIVAACAAAIVLFIRKAKGMKGDVDAARAEFLQKVGYGYVSALTPASSPVRRKDTPQGSFTHDFEVYSEGGSKITTQSWELACPAPARTVFQLVEKKMLGAARAILNLVGPNKRTLTIAYPGPHPIGDAELDARFALYANEPAAVIPTLRQADVRQSLLEFASVYLLVNESGATFCDPTDDNVYAWGASRTDVNPAPAIRSAAKVHLAVERLLRRVVGAAPVSS